MNNEITNKVNLIIIIIGAFLGLILGIFLLFRKSDSDKANALLGWLVILSLAYFGPGFLYRFDLLNRFPHVLGLSWVINLLIGPLTYLYVKACIQKGFTIRRIDWLHFLPFLLLVLYKAPEFLKSGTEKMDIFLKEVIQRELHTTQFEMLLQSFHVLIYFVLSIQLLIQYRKHVMNSSSSDNRSLYYWVLIFIWIHSIPVFCMILAYLFSSFGQYTFMVVLLSFFLFSLAVFLGILIKPELFNSFPHQIPVPNSEEDPAKKYEKSSLQEDQKEIYAKKLIQYVELNKPYLEPELTLAQLSEQTSIPPYFVSQVINEKLDRNFLEFINGYRIEEAKAKLLDKKLEHFTIIAIAYEVGFNSKSAFYSAFKKIVGSTPSQFRKQELI